MGKTLFLRKSERQIGDGQPCFIIAEAGVNHNGSLKMALQLVDVAVEAGADAVKFQKRELKELYPTDLLENPNLAEWSFQYMLPILKETELSYDEFREIDAYCRKRGIRFMCTPWDEQSLAFLEELSIEVYKVASADLINFPLLERIVATGKPLILSTGMASLEEIQCTVEFLNKLEASFALLHCVSTYPAPFENLNLRFIETMKQFDVPIGYSSHERGIAIPVAAVALGACIVEKHITLDRTLPGPDHPASLEPSGIQKLVRDIRHLEQAMGMPEKQLSAMELINRQTLRKSLVAKTDLKADTVVTREMISVRGPGKGLSPQRLNELLGCTLHRDVRAGDYFLEQDLRSPETVTIQNEHFHHRWGLKARFHDLINILEHKPKLVELHFSEHDVDHAVEFPSTPYPQQLFIHAPEFYEKRLLDLCSVDDNQRERSITLLQKTIDKAVELQPHFSGGPINIVIHVGGMTMDDTQVDHGQMLRRAIESFRLLDTKGMILLPENLPPRPWYLGGQWHQQTFMRAEEMLEFCQELGVGMTLDLSHAQLYCTAHNIRLDEYVRRCLPLVRHMHFADASGIDGEGVQIGEGVIHWEEIIEIISQKDFTWVPEIWSGHLNNAEGFVEALNRLAAYPKL
ncbi:MAG: N-acetylneuraminate synthase family protein [Anaerolineae bacterium]|nr:N-acetylneuraminate synthase family protein [Anaerolineae bacterium]